MQAKRTLFWMSSGLACAFTGLMLAHDPATAQTIADPNERARSPGTETAQSAGRASTATRGLSQNNSDDESQGTSDLPPAIPEDDPSVDPADRDPDNPDGSPRQGQNTTPQDGDLTYPAEPQPVIDGLVNAGDAPPSIDEGGEQVRPQGAAGTPRDPRDFRDIRDPEADPFIENPPAGYDPLLFQIEDIDPLRTDRRPERLARIEPYDPVGIRFGSFVYFPDMEISGVSTSNVLRSPKADSDVYAEIKSTSRLVSNWEAHALELRSTGTYNFHQDFPSEDDRAWGLEARGRLDVSKRTNIQGLVSHEVHQEGRSAIDASTSGDRPDVTTDQVGATGNHRFNRLSLQLRGTHTVVDYSDTGSGATLVRNDERDSTTNRGALRAKWEFKPTLSAFAEVEGDQREFDAPATSDGFRRDSTGERYRIGADFGTTGRILRGEVSLGWGEQRPDDKRLEATSAMLFDANLAWRVSEMTSLLLNAQTDIYDTTSTNSAGVASQTIGLEARHSFREYLIGTAGVTLSTRDYTSDPIEELELRTTLGAEYFFNREVILFGRYQHIAFESNQPKSDYDADDIRLGLRVRR